MVIGTGRRTRPVLVRLHRWAGLLLAGFLTMAGLTGSLLAFKAPLDAWLNPTLFTTSPGARLPLDTLAASLAASDPALSLRGLTLPEPGAGPVRAYVAPRGTTPLGYDEVFQDGATGRILGHRNTQGCCLAAPVLMPFIYHLHYTLAAGTPGQLVMGGLAMIWVLDSMVGLWLTLPRTAPILARWACAWRIRPTRNAIRLNRNLHSAGGLWCWAALLVLAVTAVDMNLGAPIVRPLVAALLPTTPDFARPASTPASGPLIGLDRALAAALHARPNPPARPIYIAHNAADATYAVALRTIGRTPYAGLGPDWIYIDDQTGAVLRADRAGGGLPGDVVLQSMYPLHSGQIAGLPGRIVVCVLGVMVALLSVTGVVVWWHKRRAAVGERRKEAVLF